MLSKTPIKARIFHTMVWKILDKSSLVNYPPPLHSIFYNNTKSGKGSSLVNLLHFADYKSQCAIENKTGMM